jgi:hypothetical protein
MTQTTRSTIGTVLKWKRSWRTGTVRTRIRQVIVPENTQIIALLGVRNVVTMVSDHDRFVRIRQRFAITMVVNVSVLTSSSLKLLLTAFT